MNRWWPLLLPELREFPAAEQDAALGQARDTGLDAFELLGMAAGLILVTLLTRYSLNGDSMASRFATVLLNVAAAVPLLAVLLGPFHIRRLRRGLREHLRRRIRS
jgi:hypothetical protein